MDSVFLLYLYTMIVMGCVAVWAGLYYHFVQTGVITIRRAADRENSTAPSMTASGEQSRRSQSHLANVDIHQQDEKEKTPDTGQYGFKFLNFS